MVGKEFCPPITFSRNLPGGEVEGNLIVINIFDFRQSEEFEDGLLILMRM